MRWIKSAWDMLDLHLNPGTYFSGTYQTVQIRYHEAWLNKHTIEVPDKLTPVNPDCSEKLLKQIHAPCLVNTYNLHLLQDERKDSLIKYTGSPACHLEGSQTHVCFSANRYKSMNFDAVVVFHTEACWEGTLIL